MSRTVTIPKIQNAAFFKQKTSRNWKLEKDLFLGHLQPPLDKNSKDLAILILEFDDLTVSRVGVQKEVQLGVRTSVKFQHLGKLALIAIRTIYES